MLNKDELKKELEAAVQTGTFPANGVMLSSAIKNYVTAKGTQVPPTISYTLGPATGDNWKNLILKASSSGVSEFIIQEVIVPEFSGSTKVIPAVPVPITVPMSFNLAAKVSNLSELNEFDDVWDKIAEAIIDFFKPEIV